MKTIAAFDFDGTLTYRDTLLPFLLFLAGTPAMSVALLKTSPALLPFMRGKKSRQEVKETFLYHALHSYPYDACKEGGIRFASQLEPYLKPEAMRKLKWHQSEGHDVVLISANLDLYLEPWGKKLNLTQTLTSRLADDKGKVTGKLIGLNCWGEEKVRRLLLWAGPKKNFKLWAYGDADGDRALLKLADYPFFRQF